MSRDIVDRFAGATFLGEAEFASAVVGRAFRYREIGGELLIMQPREVFLEGGRYQFHALRTASYGSYSVDRGIVSIDCSECPEDFLGLSRRRVFFRHEARLLMANAEGRGTVIELIETP